MGILVAFSIKANAAADAILPVLSWEPLPLRTLSEEALGEDYVSSISYSGLHILEREGFAEKVYAKDLRGALWKRKKSGTRKRHRRLVLPRFEPAFQ